MRSSTALLILAASLAIASPLKQVVKKDIVYDYVTDIVYVTVTDEVTVPAATVATSSIATVDDCSTTTRKTEVAVATVVAPKGNGWHPTPEHHHTKESSSTSSVVAVKTTTSVAAAPTVAKEPSSTVSVADASLDAADATSTNLITASLYHHNIHRTNHSVAAVSWNTTLAKYAATIASSCVYAHNLTPGGGGYGQNIAAFGETGDVQSLGEAHEVAQASSDMWYNGEVNSFLPSYYGEANPDFSNFDSWGHFSQMVWKDTNEIGCASQFCDAGTIFSFGSWFTVCNYGPEGNMGGEYGANVLEPLGHPTVSA